MKEPFDGRFAPTTNWIGFIKASLDETVCGAQSWQEEVFHRRPIPEEWEPSLESLLRVPGRSGALYSETTGDWVAVFVDRGGKIMSQCATLAARLARRTIQVACVPHNVDKKTHMGRYGSIQMWTYAPQPTSCDFGIPLHDERSISLAHDESRWLFNTFGKPFPFENLERYKAPRVKDRFDDVELERLCKEFRIDLFNKGFYAGRKVWVE